MDQSNIVNIRRSGNILEIDPGRLDILRPFLVYKFTSMGSMYNWQAEKREMEFIEKELYRVDGDKIYTLQGARDRVVKALTAAGCEVIYTDLRTKQTLEPDYDWFKSCMPELEFRFKQEEILATLIGKDSGQIEAPTAYGKTFIMLALAALYPKANIIMASPSTALLQGTYRRMLKITPKVGRVGGGKNDPQQVTLCTFNSIMNAPIDKCDILVLDESHKCSAPVISMNIAKIRSPVKIFGMSATPTGRSDNAHLPIEVMIGPVIAKIDYGEAVGAGVISPIKIVTTDVSELECSLHSYDYATKPAKLRNCYWRNIVRNQKFADAIREYPVKLKMPENPQILVLVNTLDHAFRMSKLLPDFQVVYASMATKTLMKLRGLGLVAQDYKPLTSAQRDNMLNAFESGTLRKVIATGCWGEGVDFKYLDVVANISGDFSSISTVQWAGRNSRLYEGKSFGLVIDSLDTWDHWANSRARQRMRTYKQKKWELIKGSTL